MHRPLGSFETAATLTNDAAPFVVVVVVALDRGPSPERLADALAALQRRHPLLGVRIAGRAGRLAYEPLEAEAAAIPLRIVDRTGEDDWRTVAEQELGSRIDSSSGPLLRAVLVHPPPTPPTPPTPATSATSVEARCEILLAFHHAIMDGASGIALVDELLDLCDGAPASGPVVEGSVLPPVETLFPGSFQGLGGKLRAAGFLGRQVADEVSFRLRTRGGRRPPIAERTRCHVLPLRLSRDETAALVQATRRRRVTLNGALGAAFLLAVDERLYAGRARALRYMTFADLRPYLDPPVSPDDLGSFLAMLRYTARLDDLPEGGDDERFWLLARRLSDQVARGARRGDKAWSVLFSKAVMSMLLRRGDQRMAATAVSYTGVARPAAPGRVRDLRAFVSNFRLGPEYTAQARIFDGELLLDILYLDVDMDAALAETLAEDIVSLLRQAGAPPDRGEEA